MRLVTASQSGKITRLLGQIFVRGRRSYTKGLSLKPVLQALVLAERVYEDRLSGKKVIAGTFNLINFKKNPPVVEQERPGGTKQRLVMGGMQSGSPYAYISLTDICGSTELLLQFVNLTQNKVLLGTKITVTCDDRLRTVEIVAPLPELPVKEEGVYALEVVCEGEILGSHRIIAKELPNIEV